MPNGAELLSIYPENDIETYRDVLYFVGQVLGGFFCISREGKLELRKYGTEPVMEIKSRHRFTSSFSDFITRYTAVSSTNLRTQTAEYYALEPDDGLTMNLAVNPLLQFGLEETRETLCRNILADISVVDYVPFDSSTIGNPALDLGDVLTFSGGQADGSQIACITSFNCKIGGKHTLKCVGKNPRLAQAKSKNDKNISGLLNQIEAGKMGLFTYTNAKAYSLSKARCAVISMEFASSQETDAQFIGQVMLEVSAAQVERQASAEGRIIVPLPAESGAEDTEMETEGNTDVEVEVSLPVKWKEDGRVSILAAYEFDDNEILTLRPEECFGSGRHILSLYYPLTGLVQERMHTFRVYLSAEGGDAAVPAGGCIASISGQAMAAATKNWDGTLEFEEYFPAAGTWAGKWLRPTGEQAAFSNPQEKAVRHTEAFAKIITGFTGLDLPE